MAHKTTAILIILFTILFAKSVLAVTFVYDDFGRLTEAHYPTKQIIYMYDNVGNRTTTEIIAAGGGGPVDTDGDGMSDDWEISNGLDPLNATDANGDADSDGVSNLLEFQSGTDPNNADTDNDGMPDGWEIANGLDPLNAADANADPDNDGLSNLQEYQAGTDPNVPNGGGGPPGGGAGFNIAAFVPVLFLLLN